MHRYINKQCENTMLLVPPLSRGIKMVCKKTETEVAHATFD